jgi:hypothetical protein
MNLPELPPSQMNVEVWDSEVRGLHSANAAYYTASQMQAFYAEGFRAGMEAAAQIADGLDCAHKCRVGSEVAAAIRAVSHRIHRQE